MGHITGVSSDRFTLQRDSRPFFTSTLYQQQVTDTYFADTCSDFAQLSVIYSVMDRNRKRCPLRPALVPVILTVRVPGWHEQASYYEMEFHFPSFCS